MNCHTWKYGPDRLPTLNADRLNRDDVRHLRWMYRHLRTFGVPRSTARMALHSAYHLGHRAGFDVGYEKGTETVRNLRGAA